MNYPGMEKAVVMLATENTQPYAYRNAEFVKAGSWVAVLLLQNIVLEP